MRGIGGRRSRNPLARGALGDAAHVRLLVHAQRLPPELRARLLPEERLEALVLSGDEDAVVRLVRDEPAGIAEVRRRYLMTEVVRRDRDLVEQLREIYLGECQLCGWAPRRSYGAELCDAHHVRWLSRGGHDDLGNLVLICPNHLLPTSLCGEMSFGALASACFTARCGRRRVSADGTE